MISTIDKTLAHILLLTRHMRGIDIPTKISVVLMEMKAPRNRIGFELLKKAIFLKHEDPTGALAGDIYLEIVLRHKQASEEQVAQAIREVIKSAWKNGSEEAWEWYFAYGGTLRRSRPSNCEFISEIACIIELWQGCEKGGCGI